MPGLFGLFERRASIESPLVPVSSAAVLDFIGGAAASDAGVKVDEQSSLKMSAVYRAVSLISGLGGSLPLHTYAKGTREQKASLLLDNPHPDLTPYEFWRLSYVHRCLWGNFYAQKVRAQSGQIQWLYPIHPSKVRVGVGTPAADNPSGKVFAVTGRDGAEVPLTSYEILHIPGMGYDGAIGLSPIRMAAQGIGMALAAEKYGAKLFGSGNLLSGILKTSQRIEQGDATRLQQRWAQMRSGLDAAHSVAVLDSGADFQSLTMPNDDAQLLESRRFQVSEVARYFGVPPFLLMETEKVNILGERALEQQALGFVKFDLHPTWLAPTEHRVSRELLPANRYAKYKSEGLLRGDSVARAQFYNTMRNIGVFSVDEIRDLEDLPPLPDGEGQGRLQPLNMAPLGSETHPDEGTPDAPQPGDE